MSNTVKYTGEYTAECHLEQVETCKLILDDGERFEVEWDTEAKVTPCGSLVFFAQYIQSGGLMDQLCRDTPLAYSSNNAPEERDILGTILLSILNGQTRYAHINALR